MDVINRFQIGHVEAYQIWQSFAAGSKAQEKHCKITNSVQGTGTAALSGLREPNRTEKPEHRVYSERQQIGAASESPHSKEAKPL